jgi:hypothetical protein
LLPLKKSAGDENEVSSGLVTGGPARNLNTFERNPTFEHNGEVQVRLISETMIRLAVIGVNGIRLAVGLAQRPLISELLDGNCGKAPGMGLSRRCTRHWSLGATETSLYQLKDLTSRFQPALDRKSRSRGAL